MFVGALATTLGQVQHKQSATGQNCKTKTLQHVKVPHEIVQHIKDCWTKKVEHGIGAV